MRNLQTYQLFEKKLVFVGKSMDKFLVDKEFNNPRSKFFLLHGTDVPPEKFNLRDDYEGDEGHVWGGDLPEGYLFLTTNKEEASAYGKYIIPCELKKYDHIFFKINADNPSQVFDDDYGISVIQQTKEHFGFWEKFEDSGKSVLVIKGNNKKWTVITDIDNIILRTDLAKEFYSGKHVNESQKIKLDVKTVLNYVSWEDSSCKDLYPGFSDEEHVGDEYFFDTRKKALSYAKDVIGLFDGLPDPVPVYRVVKAKSVEDVDVEYPGESWSFDKKSAVQFGRHNNSNFLLSAMINKKDVNWAGTVKAYALFSGGFDEDNEDEIVVDDQSKFMNIKIESLKK